MSSLSSVLGGGGGGIKSVQRGSTTGSASVTITAVDTTKTFVNVSFRSAGSSSSGQSHQTSYLNSSGNYSSSTSSYGYGYGYGYGKAGGGAFLTNATTLTITATDTNTITYWEVVEYA